MSGHRYATMIAQALDALAPDHAPCCPRCGDLGALEDVACSGCGAALYEFDAPQAIQDRARTAA